MPKNIIYVLARFVAAIIMLQTLYFKFTGAPESMFIFRSIGAEPEGRWAVGIFELLASILLIVPRTSWLGSILGVGLMLGAVGIHLFKLGIDIMNDGGQLFILAVVALLCCLYVLLANKDKINSEILTRLKK